MLAPNQGRTAIKLHGFNRPRCLHPIPAKPPRVSARKLQLSFLALLPVSAGNQMEKLHVNSAERYNNITNVFD
jgi:hypothetical protein